MPNEARNPIGSQAEDPELDDVPSPDISPSRGFLGRIWARRNGIASVLLLLIGGLWFAWGMYDRRLAPLALGIAILLLGLLAAWTTLARK